MKPFPMVKRKPLICLNCGTGKTEKHDPFVDQGDHWECDNCGHEVPKNKTQHEGP